MQKLNHLESHPSPVVTPQALAWDGEQLWVSSRDLGTLQRIDIREGKVIEEFDPPGVIWAAVLTDNGWRFTIGKGLNDDRYVYAYRKGEGFTRLFACPDFTGSYLSFDGEYLYLSQWYKGLILKVDHEGKILDQIDAGLEICGHTFANGTLYVLRGKENRDVPNQEEEWRVARVSLAEGRTQVEDVATIPFASRSLAFDGERFWSNHRAANEIMSFTLAGEGL
jgi:hypothetical protein